MTEKKVAANMERVARALEERGALTTPQTMELLGVSEATARRLFLRLAQQGRALRTFGGVCRPGADGYSYEKLSGQNQGQKQEIARTACGLCGANEVLYLDGGTTLAAFAVELAARLEAGEVRELTVFTNALSTLELLAGRCAVNLIGGRYRQNRRDFCGYIAEQAVAKLRFTACFLGADACEERRGLTTTDSETARLNTLVLAASDRSYVLADAAKFDAVSVVPYAPINGVTAIITDSALSAQRQALLAGQGIAVTRAEE